MLKQEEETAAINFSLFNNLELSYVSTVSKIEKLFHSNFFPVGPTL